MLCGALLLFWAPVPDAGKVVLKPATVEAFEAYMRTAEARFEKQNKSGTFLWVDTSPNRKQQLLQGKVLAEPWSAKGDMPIPDGLIHDWIGAAFLRGATMEKTLALVQDYNNHKKYYQPEVVDSRLLSHKDQDFKIFLRLLKKQILTVVLNSEHEVHYTKVNDDRWYSRSYSTRFAEVADAGEKGEHEMPSGNDHGFLWRLNSFWRFEERDGGVYIECEAISLTRNVPTGLGWLINPIIRSLPRESLANTLRETKEAVAQ